MSRLSTFEKREPWLRWSFPSTKLVLGGSAVAILGLALTALSALFGLLADIAPMLAPRVQGIVGAAATMLVVSGLVLAASGIAWGLMMFPRQRLKFYARKTLYAHRFGNPLSLKEGERLPDLKVIEDEPGVFWLEVLAIAVTVEELEATQSALSSGVRGKLYGHAVTVTDADPAARHVRFKIEDVTVDRSITVASLDDLATGDVTRLTVQKGAQIDLTTSGSIVAAGKTRSGKTTGVLALLVQVLSFGPDQYGSRVVIVDPKQAELSRVPNTVTLDAEGTARPILDAMREFEQTVKLRQAGLNDASEVRGDAVKWWERDMHPAFLFLDEFVALRSLIPARAEKDTPDYCVKSFDDSLRRIITMGASAGCYVIVSIAQASADQIPTMLRDAFSTRVLFRPTPDEGRLLWDSDRIAALPHRVYGPGDAWFSSTDGVHDAVSYVHFPRFAPGFGEYRVLGELLTEYHQASTRRDLPV